MIYKTTLLEKGIPKTVAAIKISDIPYVIRGKSMKTASLMNVWQNDVEDPDLTLKTLRSCGTRVDMLRFWQRIPDSEPKFNYHKEWRYIAAIPITTYDNWFTKQISGKTRNMVRKAEKKKVVIVPCPLTDELVRGIMEIYNQSPVKRGKKFWHYGKDFETVRGELSNDLSDSTFICAFFEDELIGFIKMLKTGSSTAMLTLILDKISHRDKSPINGLIAKTVETCAGMGISHLTYTVWREGDHGKFQERNGFQKIRVPEYFVPLSIRGKIALKLGLHNGLKNALPKKLYILLLKIRALLNKQKSMSR